MRMRQCPARKSRGFILGYALLGLALLSLTLMVIARMNSQGVDGRRMAETRDEVVQQAGLIRSKLLACTIAFPGGDNGLGFRLQFPAAPVSGLVADTLCPGNPNANKAVWSQGDGVYMPRTLTNLSAWRIAHDATSVRISVTAQSGGWALAALNNAARRLGPQATVSGSTLTVVIAN
jgi:hypothetical protein